MEFDQRKKCCSNRKDAKRLFEEIWNDAFTNNLVRQSIRWSLEKILLRTIGRKSVWINNKNKTH
jgi:hypothetical protein